MSEDAAAEQCWNESALAQPVAAPAWRLWTYAQAAVVLGCSQRAGLAAAAAASPLPMLARASGGGAVLVGPWMLGLSVALPPLHPLTGVGPVAGYRWLGEGIACTLRRVGVSAARAVSPDALRGRASAAAPDWACFGSLSPWEVVAGERKIAGLAQVRRRSGVLLVAGVLVEDLPWGLLCRALGRPAGEAQRLRQATTTCAAQLDPANGALAPAVAQALTRMLVETVGGPTDEAPNEAPKKRPDAAPSARVSPTAPSAPAG